VISGWLIRPRPDADAAVMISGNAFCQIYFRMGGLWDAPVDLDDLDHVVAQPVPHRSDHPCPVAPMVRQNLVRENPRRLGGPPATSRSGRQLPLRALMTIRHPMTA
jgi:hypothetical protein